MPPSAAATQPPPQAICDLRRFLHRRDERLPSQRWWDAAAEATVLRRLVQLNGLEVLAHVERHKRLQLRDGGADPQRNPLARRDHVLAAARGVLLHEAAAYGDVGMVERLLAPHRGTGIEREYRFRRDTCAAVALNGHARMLQWLYDHRERPYAAPWLEMRRPQVNIVARRGLVEVMAILIQWFPELVTPEALEEACANGRMGMIELLLAKKDTTSGLAGLETTTVEQSLRRGVDRGHLQLVPILQRLGMTVEDDLVARFEAMTLAATTDEASETPRVPASLQVFVNRDLWSILGAFQPRRHSHLADLETWYNAPSGVSTAHVEGLLARVAMQEQKQKKLLKHLEAIHAASIKPGNDTIAKYSLDSAIYDAVVEKNLAALEWLRGRPALPCRPDAMAAALEYGSRKAAEWLQEHRPESALSLEGADSYLVDAAERGNVNAIRFAHELGVGCFTPAVMDAAAGTSSAIVEFLQTHRREGCTHLALERAIRSKRIKTVQILHQHYKAQVTVEAVALAVRSSRRVLSYLWKSRDDEPVISAGLQRGLRGLQVVEFLPLFCRDGASMGEHVGFFPARGDASRHELARWIKQATDEATVGAVIKAMIKHGKYVEAVASIVLSGEVPANQLQECILFAITQERFDYAKAMMDANIESAACKEKIYEVLRKHLEGCVREDKTKNCNGAPINEPDDAIAAFKLSRDPATQRFLIETANNRYSDAILLEFIAPRWCGYVLKDVLSSEEGARNRNERRTYTGLFEVKEEREEKERKEAEKQKEKDKHRQKQKQKVDKDEKADDGDDDDNGEEGEDDDDDSEAISDHATSNDVDIEDEDDNGGPGKLTLTELQLLFERQDPVLLAAARRGGQPIIPVALIAKVAAKGKLDLIKSVHVFDPSLVSNAVGKSMTSAIEHGHVGVFDWLDLTFPGEHGILGVAVLKAAKKQQFSAIKHLITRFSDNLGLLTSLRRVIEGAFVLGRMEVLQGLWPSQSISFLSSVDTNGESEKVNVEVLESVVRRSLILCDLCVISPGLQGAIRCADTLVIELLIDNTQVSITDKDLAQIYQIAVATRASTLLTILRQRYQDRLDSLHDKDQEQQSEAMAIFGVARSPPKPVNRSSRKPGGARLAHGNRRGPTNQKINFASKAADGESTQSTTTSNTFTFTWPSA